MYDVIWQSVYALGLLRGLGREVWMNIDVLVNREVEIMTSALAAAIKSSQVQFDVTFSAHYECL